MKQKSLTIGLLASQAEVNVETIRYYQRIGLIEEPAKPTQGFRTYPQKTLQRVKFIKRAQQLGFSLQEIDELLELGNGSSANTCSDVRQRAEGKVEQISQQIQDLEGLRTALNQLIRSCKKGGNHASCPIVENLLHE